MSTRGQWAVVGGIVAALAVVFAILSTKVGAELFPLKIGDPAPDFTAVALADSVTKHVDDYKGEVVLLNIWATWCGPCRVEMPWFVELQERYRKRGLTMIGVSLDDDGWTSVRPFAAAQHVTYPLAIGDGRVARAFGGIDVLPSTFIVDRSGRIAVAHEGLVPKETYEQEIAALLG